MLLRITTANCTHVQQRATQPWLLKLSWISRATDTTWSDSSPFRTAKHQSKHTKIRSYLRWFYPASDTNVVGRRERLLLIHIIINRQTDRQDIRTFSCPHRGSEDKYTPSAGLTVEVVESAGTLPDGFYYRSSRRRVDLLLLRVRVAPAWLGLKGTARRRRPSPIRV